YLDPLALVANSLTLYNPSQSPQHSGSSMYPPPQQFTPVYAAPIHHQYHHTPVNPQQHLASPQPFISPPVSHHSQADFPQLDSASRFLPLNNQLITSSNLRNQATIQDGKVIVQQVQGRQSQSFAGTGNIGFTTTSRGNYATGQPRVVKCYNCQGEGHMARQCTQPKRRVLSLKKAKTKDLDAYDSDFDDLSSAKAVRMAILLSCDSDVLSEDTNSAAPNDLLVLSLVEQMTDHVAHLDKENQTNKMLNKIKDDFGKRFITKKELSAEQAFWLKHSPFSETPIMSHTPVRIEAPRVNFLSSVTKKDTFIRKLKDRIKSLSRKDNVENVKKDIDEIETINIELEHSVTPLLSKNENLRKERELNAQLQEKVFAIATVKNELRKLKGKNVVDTAVSKPSATIAP
ncbi:integrase, catalytic region, zinc finger, CCHC-type containing protein, partial [Tanacetum coccineum]